MNQLAFVAAQHRELKRRLAEEDPSLDEETLADTVEGLTDLHEIISAVMRSALADEALADGLRGRIGDMQGRLARLEDRASKRRQIARDVMADLGIRKITAPDFTLSLRPGTPALMVVDEKKIPDTFFEARPPKLNRQALLDALKQGATVDGAALSNPPPALSVRRK